MKENLRGFWKTLWNEKAKSDNVFVQAGRSSYSPLDFFLMMRDINRVLQLAKQDVVLDAGGGSGLVTMCIAPFVKEVTLFDYAEKMVDRAKQCSEDFDNIRVRHDNILSMGKVRDRQYTKVIVGSVLQYLEDYGQIKISLCNAYKIIASGGTALFTHNPDIRKKEKYIDSYKYLNWDKQRIKQSLEWEERRLWLDIERIKEISSQIGFSICDEVSVNPKLFESTYMFSFMIKK